MAWPRGSAGKTNYQEMYERGAFTLPFFICLPSRFVMPSLYLTSGTQEKGDTMLEWMLMPYRRYFDFSGRSRRKEYWMFILLYVIIAIALTLLMLAGGMAMDPATGAPAMGTTFYLGAGLLGIYGLATIIPAIAVQVRRFHDQDKSGWFVLLNFIPYVGGLIVLVFMCLEGTRGPNRFGPDPKDPAGVEVFS